MAELPGGPMASRPLHFFFVADCSGSMYGDKIAALNTGVREAIPHMREVAADNPNAQVLVRAVKFSSGAQWHVAHPTPVEDFEWVDVTESGVTDMGQAMKLVASQLAIPPMAARALPPVIVLLSDGQPTDDFTGGLKQLMALPWGKKAVRIAIAIGEDADLDVLQKFIKHPELKPLRSHSPEELVKQIRWASTVPLQAASAPPSQAAGSPGGAVNVPIPQPPPDIAGTVASATDVW